MKHSFSHYWTSRQTQWYHVALAAMLIALSITFGAFSQASTTHAASVRPFDCPTVCRLTSQLIFLDFRGDVNSIKISGPNQYDHTYTYNCLGTPGRKTALFNFWWASTTYVTLYRNSNCTGLIGSDPNLNFASDGTAYRCLEDVSPFDDWDSSDGNCGTQYG